MKFKSYNLNRAVRRAPPPEQPCYGYLYQGYRLPRSIHGINGSNRTWRQKVQYLDASYDILAFTPSVAYLDASYDLLAYKPAVQYLDASYDILAYKQAVQYLDASYDLNAYAEKVQYLDASYDVLAYKPSVQYLDASYDILGYKQKVQYLDAAYDLLAYQQRIQYLDASYDLNAYVARVQYLDASYDLLANERFYTWMINLTTGAVSKADNYSFNSLSGAMGADSTGIHTLTGTTDNGVAINGFVESGRLDFGATELKRITDAYIGVDGGALDLTITDERTGANRYRLAATTQFKTTKANLGKGCKGRYWKVKLANVSGSAALVDDVELSVEKLTRRV